MTVAHMSLLAEPHHGLASTKNVKEMIAAANNLRFVVAGSASARHAAILGGALPLLLRPLQSESDEVVTAACNAVGALTQRCRVGQDSARKCGLLHAVLRILMGGTPHEKIGIAACTALGALTNANADNQACVLQASGVAHVVSIAIRSGFAELRLRALYSLSCLATSNAAVRTEVIANGGVDAAVALLPPRTSHDARVQRQAILALSTLRGLMSNIEGQQALASCTHGVHAVCSQLQSVPMVATAACHALSAAVDGSVNSQQTICSKALPRLAQILGYHPAWVGAGAGSVHGGATDTDTECDGALTAVEMQMVERRINADMLPDCLRTAACRTVAALAQVDGACKAEISTHHLLPPLMVLARCNPRTGGCRRGRDAASKLSASALATLSSALMDSPSNQKEVLVRGGVGLLCDWLSDESDGSHRWQGGRREPPEVDEGDASSRCGQCQRHAIYCLAVLAHGDASVATSIFERLGRSLRPIFTSLHDASASVEATGPATVSVHAAATTAKSNATANALADDQGEALDAAGQLAGTMGGAVATLVGIFAMHGILSSAESAPRDAELRQIADSLGQHGDAPGAAVTCYMQLVRGARAHGSVADAKEVQLRISTALGAGNGLRDLVGLLTHGQGPLVLESPGQLDRRLVAPVDARWAAVDVAAAQGAVALIMEVCDATPAIRPAVCATGAIGSLVALISLPEAPNGAPLPMTALGALTCLAAMDRCFQELARGAGAIGTLLGLLERAAAQPVQLHVLSALSALAAGHVANSHAMREAGAIPLIVGLTQPTSSAEVAVLAAHALAHLAAHNEANQRAIADEGGLVALVALAAQYQQSPQQPRVRVPRANAFDAHAAARAAVVEQALHACALDNAYNDAAIMEARRAARIGALRYSRPQDWHRFRMPSQQLMTIMVAR